MGRGSNSAAKLDRQWQKIQSFVNSPRLLSGLPPFASRIAARFFDVDAHDLHAAMRHGDVALFIAYLARIEQLHVAAVAHGRTVAEIAPIARCKGTIEGYFLVAEARLRELGGRWPLTDEAREESPGSRAST